MRNRASQFVALVASCLIPCVGCGQGAGTGAGGETVPVKGKVTYKGQPVTQGVVTFEPVDAGRVATGDIQSDGTFVLTTVKTGDGAVVGRHKVGVGVSGPAGKKSRETLPGKYGSVNLSGLEAKVSRDKTEYSFDLK